MDLSEKIKKKIQDKEMQLDKIKSAHKKYEDKNWKNLDEDLKFKNCINPFYKKKYHDTFGADLALIGLQVGIEREIQELKELLKPTTTEKS